jgi:hypothetical protein
MFKKKDQFMFLLAAFVVIISSFLIIQRHLAADEAQAKVMGAKTYRKYSAGDLMKELLKTRDDGGTVELKQLKSQSGGL